MSTYRSSYGEVRSRKHPLRRLGLVLVLVLLFPLAYGVYSSAPAGADAPAGVGAAKRSLLLDGDGDYVEVPYASDLNTLSAITIEAWVKRTASRCETVVGNGWRESYWLGFCNGPIRFYHTGYQRVDGSTNILPGQWTHIAVTYDGTTRRYYVNGQLDLETTANNGPITGAPGGAVLGIGGDRHGGCTDATLCGFQGLIDEVRIWNVVRTQAEIRADMYRAISGTQPGLVAVWHFDGDAQDAVGGHHGTLQGNATFSSEGFPAAPVYLPLVMR